MTATAELRMPLGYVTMDAEEMEYLEGGYTVLKTISARACNDIAIGITAGCGLLALLAACCGRAIAAKVITVIGIVGAAYFGFAGNHNGLEIYQNWFQFGVKIKW